jgi:hypothetical protein
MGAVISPHRRVGGTTEMEMTDHLDHPMDESTLRLSRRAALLLGGAAAMTALASHAAAPLAKDGKPFEILFVIYPNGTLQDFVGPNEVFTRIPNTRVRFASPAGGPVVLEHGLIFGASEKLSSIESTDLVCLAARTFPRC